MPVEKEQLGARMPTTATGNSGAEQTPPRGARGTPPPRRHRALRSAPKGGVRPSPCGRVDPLACALQPQAPGRVQAGGGGRQRGPRVGVGRLDQGAGQAWGGRAESAQRCLRSRVRSGGGKAPPRGGRGRQIKGHPSGRGPGQQPAPAALSALCRRPTGVLPAGKCRRGAQPDSPDMSFPTRR